MPPPHYPFRMVIIVCEKKRCRWRLNVLFSRQTLKVTMSVWPSSAEGCFVPQRSTPSVPTTQNLYCIVTWLKSTKCVRDPETQCVPFKKKGRRRGSFCSSRLNQSTKLLGYFQRKCDRSGDTEVSQDTSYNALQIEN